MGRLAEVALPVRRKDPAPRPPLTLAADEELADRRVVAVVVRQVPGPPAGVVRVRLVADERVEAAFYTARSTSIFLVSAIALAGFSPFGQTFAQFMIVWQR